MKNQIISRIITTLVVFVLLAVTFSLLFQRGMKRPKYRYPEFTETAKSWVEKMDRYNIDQNLSFKNIGPFDWDNDKDYGQTDKETEWEYETNGFAIVYYHPDKNAENKLNALNILEFVDAIVPETEEILGKYPSTEEMNGRKLPIYLPIDGEEYNSLVQLLANGNASKGSKYGCSVMEYGPLGCLMRGIVVHPDAFKQYNGEQRYIKVIRREMMHYAYLNLIDYNLEVPKPYFWFSNGLAEYFAHGAAENGMTLLPPDYVDVIHKQCKLNAEFPQKNQTHVWAGCSFFEYMDVVYGKEVLANIIQDTDSASLDSVFYKYNIDIEQVKYQWVDTLMKMNNIHEY